MLPNQWLSFPLKHAPPTFPCALLHKFSRSVCCCFLLFSGLFPKFDYIFCCQFKIERECILHGKRSDKINTILSDDDNVILIYSSLIRQNEVDPDESLSLWFGFRFKQLKSLFKQTIFLCVRCMRFTIFLCLFGFIPCNFRIVRALSIFQLNGMNKTHYAKQ